MGKDERKHRSRKDDRREDKSKRGSEDEERRHRRRRKHRDDDDSKDSRRDRKKRRDDDSHEERKRKRRKRRHRDEDSSSSDSDEDRSKRRRKHHRDSSNSSRRKDKKQRAIEEEEKEQQRQVVQEGIERIGRGRGRGLSNLPAWLVEQQRNQREDGLGKSNHSSSDEDRKRRKHDSRRKDKKRSSRSSSDKRKHKEKKKDKKDRKEKKRVTKRPDKSKMQPMGPTFGKTPDKVIDPVQDYYSYHEHFWVYLYREEGVAFNDMTSEESKEAFERFAKEYNAGNLEEEYYKEKLPSNVMEESKTTKHSWSFNNVLTDREKKGLQTVQQGIRQQTEYKNDKKLLPPPVGAPICQPTTNTSTVEAPTFSRKTPEEIQDERRANQRLRTHVRNVQEELDGGPKDFRERQLEKKRQQADRMHGASRQREDAGMELDDSALYGGGDESHTARRFQQAKARKARREEERANRIQELQAKEQGRQENMLEMLGLKNIKPGQKITIAPRQDG